MVVGLVAITGSRIGGLGTGCHMVVGSGGTRQSEDGITVLIIYKTILHGAADTWQQGASNGGW